MSKTLAIVAVIVVSFAMPARAHRVDEYLQATLISIEKDHVEVFLRLTPGIAVSSAVLASIDTDGDGIISDHEKRAYADRVLADLSLSLDGHHLMPKLVSVDFPKIEEMKEGLGEIQLAFAATLPNGGSDRTFIFENHHQSPIAAYLVNCLTPRDRNIRVLAQNRNQDQSFYQLDYLQSDASLQPLSGLREFNGSPDAAALSLFATIVWLSGRLVLARFRGSQRTRSGCRLPRARNV
ncbi:MAG: hypothetical protein WBS19_03725 [Candidatus Korobacteraceae bacterium]